VPPPPREMSWIVPFAFGLPNSGGVLLVGYRIAVPELGRHMVLISAPKERRR